MDLLSPKTEKEAVGVVERAIKFANADVSLTPTQAVVKAAEDHDFTPDMLCRLVEAYNSSASLAHLEGADDSKRADAIPLADPVDVVNHFFPPEPKTPSEKAAETKIPKAYETKQSGDFMAVKAPMTKEAGIKLSELPQPRRYDIDRGALHQVIHRKKASSYQLAATLKTEAREHLHKVAAAADSLAAYFRKISHDAFEDVETRALSYYGETIKPILAHAFDAATLEALGEKRGSADGKVYYVNEAVEPYCYLKTAVDSREKYAQALTKTADILDKADADYTERMQKFAEYVKHAALGPQIEGALSGAFQMPEKQQPLLAKEIMDPEHEANIAAIRQRAVLSDMMVNDPVISAIEPEMVVRAFNELSATAPHVARNPALLKSLLRRRVQQEDVDPMEIKQMIDMDTSLQTRDEPKSEFQVLG